MPAGFQDRSRSNSIPNQRIIRQSSLLEQNLTRNRHNKNQVGRKEEKQRVSRLQTGTSRDDSSAEITLDQIKKFALKKDGSRSPSPLGRFHQNLDKSSKGEALEF